MTAAVFEERTDPGQLASALLSASVHVLLLAVLIFGVRWQNRPPEAVQVELWELPPPATEAPRPVPVPRVEPPAVVKPEPVPPKPEIVEQKAPPPKPVPKVPPKVEPKPPPPKPVAKVEPKPVPKPEPLKPRVDDTQKRMREEAAREQASLAVAHEQQRLKDLAAREAASVESSALASWKEKVALHIRGRIRIEVAQAVSGNPDAIFMVTILPSYEVLKISKVKSSGNAAYDDEVERAILRASPLPRPDKPELFSRELRLTFRPKDR
ncbi:MAG TPA: energy transducer TonB [Burkholderiales bacterium]